MELSTAITLGIRLVYLLVGTMLLWRGYDERALLGAYAGASVLGALSFGLVLRHRLGKGLALYWANELGAWMRGPRERATRPLPYRGWRDVLGESVPFAVTGVVAMVYARADLLVLSFFQGDVVAGRYGMAYRLWEAMGMIPASFLDALFPELSRLGGRGADLARLRILYRRGWRIVAAGAVLLSTATQVAAATLSVLLYGRTADSELAVRILRMLLFAFPFTYLYLLNGHALYAVGRQRRVSTAMTALTATKLILNAMAVPRWSTWGAASVALACEGALFAWLQVLVWRSMLRISGASGREGLASTESVEKSSKSNG
jgi:O-antigen/teichoic acid export membrane protein